MRLFQRECQPRDLQPTSAANRPAGAGVEIIEEQYQGPVRVPHVPGRPLLRIGVEGLCQRIPIGERPVFSPTASRAPAPNEKTLPERPVERRPVDTGLASGDQLPKLQYDPLALFSQNQPSSVRCRLQRLKLETQSHPNGSVPPKERMPSPGPYQPLQSQGLVTGPATCFVLLPIRTLSRFG